MLQPEILFNLFRKMATDTELTIKHAGNMDMPTSGTWFTFKDGTENVEAEWSKMTEREFDKKTETYSRTKIEYSETVVSINGFSREENGFIPVKQGLSTIAKWLDYRYNYSQDENLGEYNLYIVIPKNDRTIEDRAAFDSPEFNNQKGFDFRIWHHKRQSVEDAPYATTIGISYENDREKTGSFKVEKPTT